MKKYLKINRFLTNQIRKMKNQNFKKIYILWYFIKNIYQIDLKVKVVKFGKIHKNKIINFYFNNLVKLKKKKCTI